MNSQGENFMNPPAFLALCNTIHFAAALATGLVLCGTVSAQDSYIPEPQPVQSDFEIAAFYYPGTEQMAEWDMVEETRPEIKPLLGWYDEGNPEVVDWQIKWAVEHGIQIFYVDWYWNQGEQRLDHWVKAFYKAKFRKYLKWCIMWANHNEPGAHSTEDQINVTKFWLENYFKTPEYYTIDGKPVVVIWEYNNLDRDFIDEAARNGETLPPGEGAKRALEITEKLVKDAGLPGVYFIDMYHSWKYDTKKIENPRKSGYDAQMIYNFDRIAYWMRPENRTESDTPTDFSYDLIADAIPEWWEMTSAKDSDFPFFPMIPTGWNDQPRSFQKACVVRDRTPEKFRSLCENCRSFCEKKGIRRMIIAPLNEWQEGSYIEPNAEYGFAMYDVLRDVFCQKPASGWPENLTPERVGRGPYDFPKMEHSALRAWEFTTDPEGWYRQPYGTGLVRVHDGALHLVRTMPDRTAIRIRTTEFDASDFCTFKVRMRVSGEPLRGDEKTKLYWGTVEHPIFDKSLTISEQNTMEQAVIADGEFHEYVFPLSTSSNWVGRVDELWFDPINLRHAVVDVDWIRFE